MIVGEKKRAKKTKSGVYFWRMVLLTIFKRLWFNFFSVFIEKILNEKKNFADNKNIIIKKNKSKYNKKILF